MTLTHHPILLPLFAQVLLTFLVWIWLYVTRLGTMWKQKVDPQELASEARSDEILASVVNPSDNFENLFELPVLFYAACILAVMLQLDDPTLLRAAWVFVAFRVLHSLIHCTTNRILHRFSAYLVAAVALWFFWGRLAYLVFTD